MHSDSSTPRQWSTPVGLVVFGWLLTGASGLWLAAADAAADRLFVAVVLVTLLSASSYGSFMRPRLRADRDGIVVRSLRGRRSWAWHEVNVQVRQERRLGRTVEALEIEEPEPGSELIVLTKLDLGEDLQDVIATLDSLRR